MTDPWKVLDGHGGESVVAVRPSMIRLVGAPAAIWLAQALFYQRRFADADGWFRVKLEQFEAETGLSAESQKSARNRLEKAGLLETKHGAGYTLNYRVNASALVAALDAGTAFTAKNPAIPESGDSRNRKSQKLESPETGKPGSQNPENTGSQNPESPEAPNKERDLSLRSFFETSTTTPTELDLNKLAPGSSGEIVEVVETREVQPPTPGSDARGQPPEPAGTPGHAGETRTGSEDSPGAAARLEAAQALEKYLGGVRCVTKYPNDHAQYLEGRDRWLEDRRPEFILECINAARNGKGVEKSPYGALIKWLEFPASAPDSARELDLRLERGLTPRLERLPRRWYRTGDGLDLWVESWKAGDAVLDGGSRAARAVTRLWTMHPEGYEPTSSPSPTVHTASGVTDRATPEQIAARLEEFRNRTAGRQP
jgi:hypothetical protein